jgi:ribonuclease HI
VEELVLYGDSELVVRQLQGAYRVKAPHLVPLFLQVMQLRREIPQFRIEHVPRAENRRADELANRAIDERLPLPEWLLPMLPAIG